MNELKNQILNKIKQNVGCSFVEILKIKGCTGKQQMLFKKSNIILWSGLSIECTKVLDILLKEKKIVMRQSQVLIYIIDGCTLNYPVAKSSRIYQKMHWLPVVFDLRDRKIRDKFIN